MTNEICSTSDDDSYADDSGDVRSDIVATHTAENRGMEFHVSLRDYTLSDMESLIVDAAANILVSKYGQNALSKLVQERALEAITKKIDAHLTQVTHEIVEAPMMVNPGWPSKEPPVTLREFIGLTGREYLTQRVDHSGRPTIDSYSSRPRMQQIVEHYMDNKFKLEIQNSVNALIAEIRLEFRTIHEKFLTEERNRIREAMKGLLK